MFKPNQSGNPNGRKAGSLNKVTKDVKVILQKIVEGNLHFLQLNQDELSNQERIMLTKALLPYVAPKLQSISINTNDTQTFNPIEVIIVPPHADK
jgi:tellurite resistance-related uncharacterized protein